MAVIPQEHDKVRARRHELNDGLTDRADRKRRVAPARNAEAGHAAARGAIGADAWSTAPGHERRDRADLRRLHGRKPCHVAFAVYLNEFDLPGSRRPPENESRLVWAGGGVDTDVAVYTSEHEPLRRAGFLPAQPSARRYDNESPDAEYQQRGSK